MRMAGGMYPVALPSGEWAYLMPGSHLDTSVGRITLPGFDILELDITNVPEFQIAGKAQVGANDPRRGTWEWSGSKGWVHISLSAHGTYPAVFTNDGLVALADPVQNGSQGWRYVDEHGRLVTGDDTLNPSRRVGQELGLTELWEFSHFAGVTIGQGITPNGCHVLIDNTRRLIEPGDCRFIRVKYAAGKWAVSITKLAEREAVIEWLDRSALSTRPRITSIDVTPTPPPVTPPEPPPVEPPKMPDSLLPTVEAVRAKHTEITPEILGAMLNEIAWTHREDGWGLNSKPSGNSCPQPRTGIRVAVDILHHKPSDTIWDCFGDAGGETRPSWGEAHPHGDPNRVWVAPVAPDGVIPPPEPPPLPPPIPGIPVPNPGTDLEVLKRLDAIEKRVERMENAGFVKLGDLIYKP
jgi:hypothetical protein